MDSIEISTILAVAAAITTIGTAWLTIRKINRDNKNTRTLEKAEILQQAKEEIAKAKKDLVHTRELIKKELEGSIADLQTELDAYKKSNDREIEHVKETLNGSISNLGEKIEGLREELHNQHGQLVGLLTKLIDTKK